MPLINEQVANAFHELADLLEIAGDDRFRPLAYRRVAAEIAATARDIAQFGEAELIAIKGVGKATALMIKQLIQTGSCEKLDEARMLVPPGVLEMTRIPGLGPKRALLLHSELGVATIEELGDAIQGERLRGVKGLGIKTEKSLARAMEALSKQDKRTGLEEALSIAEELREPLLASGAATAAEVCGSLRRMKETIGDVDLLVSGVDPPQTIEILGQLAVVSETSVGGSTKASVVTITGLKVDLRTVAEEEFGSALQYFTGSKEHNVRVREIAVKKGYKLSEYGLFEVKGNRRLAGETEDGVYDALGMQTPPPTMRENRGEVELSLQGKLPAPVHLADIRGDLHSHSTYSDGTSTVEEMAASAAGLGYEYFAITDHIRSHHVRSHSRDSLLRQREEIDAINARMAGRTTILQGVEVDIGPGGELAALDDLDVALDLIIVSIHHAFEQSSRQMTQRVCRALSHPLVNIFGHPTGRRIGTRPPVDMDLEKIFEQAAVHQVALEINSTPTRLDLKDDHIRLAKSYGCRFSIDTDSHAAIRLPRMRLGVGMAQRGWLRASEVINCGGIDELRQFITKT